jgi:hypothetical protein
MSEASQNCEGKTCEATGACICSPASADGTTPCDSQDGPTTDLFGQALAHAKPNQSQARDSGRKTLATYGQTCFASSKSIALQRSLASKLQERPELDGSTVYVQTWKRKATPLGFTYLEHTARARCTDGSGFTGVPTPAACDHKGSGSPRPNRGPGNNLRDWFKQNYNFLYPPARVVLWLMGYPAEWSNCAEQVTQSCQRVQRRS